MTDLFETCCPHCRRPYDTIRTDFVAFWEIVPHKIGKESAGRAWQKLSWPERAEAQARVRVFYEWFKRTYPTASPLHPATYLNGKRWQDEAIATKMAGMSPELRASILDGMKSSVDSVRDHSRRMAERHGIGGET